MFSSCTCFFISYSLFNSSTVLLNISINGTQDIAYGLLYTLRNDLTHTYTDTYRNHLTQTSSSVLFEYVCDLFFIIKTIYMRINLIISYTRIKTGTIVFFTGFFFAVKKSVSWCCLAFVYSFAKVNLVLVIRALLVGVGYKNL